MAELKVSFDKIVFKVAAIPKTINEKTVIYDNKNKVFYVDQWLIKLKDVLKE